MRFLTSSFAALVLVACQSSSSPPDASAMSDSAIEMDAIASDASDATMTSDSATDSPADVSLPSDAGTFACGPSLMCKRIDEFCFDLDGNYQCRATPAQCKPVPSCTCPDYSGTGMCMCGANGPDVHWSCKA